jgi:hypothetical protein
LRIESKGITQSCREDPYSLLYWLL